MKHAGYILLFFVFVTCGCRSNKSVARSGESSFSEQVAEKTVEKTTTEEHKGTQIHSSAKEETFEYSRISQIDTAGNVHTIQETWRQVGRIELAVLNDSSRNISLSDVVANRVVSTDIDSVYNEVANTKSDTRIIQGSEWLWLLFGVGLVIGFFLFLKR